MPTSRRWYNFPVSGAQYDNCLLLNPACCSLLFVDDVECNLQVLSSDVGHLWNDLLFFFVADPWRKQHQNWSPSREQQLGDDCYHRKESKLWSCSPQNSCHPKGAGKWSDLSVADKGLENVARMHKFRRNGCRGGGQETAVRVSLFLNLKPNILAKFASSSEPWFMPVVSVTSFREVSFPSLSGCK